MHRTGKQGHIQIATILSTAILSTALTLGTAIAQQKQQGQQQMTAPRDSLIQARIELRLARSSSLSGTDITVDVEGRVATLSGTVGSEQERERAVQLARKVKGVKDVQADLNVDKETVEQRRNVEVEDDTLVQQVAKKLADETFPQAEVDEGLFGTVEVDGYNWEFEVEVDAGIVTLEGDVDSYTDIHDAVSAARAVPGVKAVNSELWVDTYEPYYHPYYFRPYYAERYFDLYD